MKTKPNQTQKNHQTKILSQFDRIWWNMLSPSWRIPGIPLHWRSKCRPSLPLKAKRHKWLRLIQTQHQMNINSFWIFWVAGFDLRVGWWRLFVWKPFSSRFVCEKQWRIHIVSAATRVDSTGRIQRNKSTLIDADLFKMAAWDFSTKLIFHMLEMALNCIEMA